MSLKENKHYFNCPAGASSSGHRPRRCVESYLGLDGIVPAWHIFRIEFEPETMTIIYFVDGIRVGAFMPQDSIPAEYNDFKQLEFHFCVGMNNFGSAKSPVGYIDYVRIGAIADDPIVYDNFDKPEFDGKLNLSKWAYAVHDPEGSMYQENGELVFRQNGTKDRSQFLRGISIDSYPNTSALFESKMRLDSELKGGEIQLRFGSKYGLAACGISGPHATAFCWCNVGDHQYLNRDFSINISDWHIFDIRFEQSTMTYRFQIDNKQIGYCSLLSSNDTPDLSADFAVGVGFVSNSVKGYVEYVRIVPLK